MHNQTDSKDLVFIQCNRDLAEFLRMTKYPELIKFVVIGNEGLYRFVLKNLKYDALFVETKSFRQDPFFQKNKRALNKALHLLNKIQISNIWYFSNLLDPFTIYLIKMIRMNKKIFLCDYFQDDRFKETNISPLNFYKSTIFKIFLGLNSSALELGKRQYLFFTDLLEHVERRNVENKYEIRKEKILKDNSIILFVNEENYRFKNYMQVVEDIKKRLEHHKINFTFFYKTKYGYEDERFKDLGFIELPSYLPAEFIDFSKATCICDISGAMLNANMVVSFAKLLTPPFYKNDLYDYWSDSAKKANIPLFFPSSVDKLCKIIASKHEKN